MRAQLAVDALLFVLLVSMALVAIGVSLGRESLHALGTRYEAEQHQQGLRALMDRSLSLSDARGRAFDLLVLRACQGCPSGNRYCFSLEQALNQSLGELSPSRHYVLTAGSEPSGKANLVLFDSKPTACLERVSPARLEYNASCGERLLVVYGTWPSEGLAPNC